MAVKEATSNPPYNDTTEKISSLILWINYLKTINLECFKKGETVYAILIKPSLFQLSLNRLINRITSTITTTMKIPTPFPSPASGLEKKTIATAIVIIVQKATTILETNLLINFSF